MKRSVGLLSLIAIAAIAGCSSASTSSPVSTSAPLAADASVAVPPSAPPVATPSIGGVTSANPTASGPTATPGWAERFPIETADKFFHPFTYAVDPSTGLGFAPCCPPNEDMYQFRMSNGASGDWSLPIVVIEHIHALRTNNFCQDSGGAVNASPSPQDYVNLMASAPGLVATPLPDLTVDGRDAKGVDVQAGALPSGCDDVWLFEPGNPYIAPQPEGNTRRSYALDVDGDLVVITVPFTPDVKDRNLSLAGPLINTLRFDPGLPSASVGR